MSDVWVYKEDGTKQCGWGTEIPIDKMEQELAGLIGPREILGREKRTLPLVFPEVCGAPTGKVNAYKITEAGAYKLFHGFVGPNGFKLWIWPPRQVGELAVARGGDSVPFPLSAKDSPGAETMKSSLTNMLASVNQAGNQPVLVRDLIGHPARYYKHGDGLTMDYRPNRVNIEHDENNVIMRIWFG